MRRAGVRGWSQGDTVRLATGLSLGFATAAVLGLVASRRSRSASNGAARGTVRRPAIVTINRSTAEVYAFWRRLENLPRFMPHLRSVEVVDERWSNWVIDALGTTIAWKAEIVADEHDRRIAWRSVEDADVPNEGEVTFVPAPGGRGTEVRVTMTYTPPGGALGAAGAKLLGEDPAARLPADLRRLKQILESGEVPTTAGQPTGRRSPIGTTLERYEYGSQS